MVWQQLACRFSLGDMAPAQAARGSFRQEPVEPENMVIKYEIQAAAREKPQWLLWQQPAGRGDNGCIKIILANVVLKHAALGICES